MKIARFSVDGADPRYGILDGDDYVVLSGDPMFSGFGTTGERVAASDVKLLAPVIPRSKVVCIGLNYAAHRDELKNDAASPEAPLIFLKPNTAVVGPGDTIQMPPVEGRIVHEGELVIVIGKIAKRVKAADYADVIFGYTIGNDVSARDQMFADGQWARAKGYDTFAPLGPVIETELDWANLEIQTYVDGEPRRKTVAFAVVSRNLRTVRSCLPPPPRCVRLPRSSGFRAPPCPTPCAAPRASIPPPRRA